MAAGIILLPCMPALDRNGDPVEGALLYFYENETTTPRAVYSDVNLTTPLSNPVVADSAGQFPQIFADEELYYSVLGFDPHGRTLPSGSWDYVQASVSLILDLEASAFGTALIQAEDGEEARTILDAYSKDETKDLFYEVGVAGFYAGALPYVSPYTSLSYATRQTAPDITTALTAAIVEANARAVSGGRVVSVQVPSGLFTTSASIPLLNGVHVVGCGRDLGPNATHIRRIGDFGDTFTMGTIPYSPGSFIADAGIRNMRIYQDHGKDGAEGWELSHTGTFINKATTGAHINMSQPISCNIEEVDLYGLNTGISMYGGFSTTMSKVSVNGIWDLTDAARQEGVNGIVIDGDTAAAIPTYCVLEDILFNGAIVPGVNISYGQAAYNTGGNLKTANLNIGFKYGLVIKCAEEVYIRRMTAQTMAKSDVLIRSSVNKIIQGVQFIGCTFDPCGPTLDDACVKFENDDVNGQVASVLFSGCQWLGQTVTYRGISDYGSTAVNGSVNSLNLSGCQISSLVGNPVWLENARHPIIDADVKDWNNTNLFTGNDACGIYLGSGTKTALVSGVLGGNTVGSYTGHFCVDGVRAADAFTGRVKVTAINGGLTGNLFVSNGTALITDTSAPGCIQGPDADVTITWGSSARIYFAAGLTAPRTYIAATTDVYGNALENGAYFDVLNVGTTDNYINLTGFGFLYPGQRCRIIWLNGAWRNGGLTFMTRYSVVGAPGIVAATGFSYVWGTSPTTVIVDSALAALMTVTLPTTSVPDGAKIRFVRTPNATGAFNLVAGPLTLTAASVHGDVEFVLASTAWRVTGVGSAAVSI